MALAGLRVIELAGLAPAPFCGMILADFGAKVIRVDRTKVPMSLDTQGRGKKSVAINLKTAEGVALLRKLCVQSDVVLEPYRQGQASSLEEKQKNLNLYATSFNRMLVQSPKLRCLLVLFLDMFLHLLTLKVFRNS